MEYLNVIVRLLELVGVGGLGVLFTLRYQRRKAAAEAKSAEADAEKTNAEAHGAEASAEKEFQDIYQQLITDIKADRDEQKAYIQELKDDRRHLRQENTDLRNRVDSTDEDVRQLKKEVARTGRMVEFMRPFLCGKTKCQDRVNVTIQDDGEVKQSKKPKGDNYDKQE